MSYPSSAVLMKATSQKPRYIRLHRTRWDTVRQFRRLARIVAGRGGGQTENGRRWSLPLADRVLLMAVYYRTNLTLRQVTLLFRVSKSAAHRWSTTWRRCSHWPRVPVGTVRTPC
jgi:hypothetical protein